MFDQNNVVVIDENKVDESIKIDAQTSIETSNDTNDANEKKAGSKRSKRENKIKPVNSKKFVSLYRENSKHAFVVGLLCRGITFEDLQKRLQEKYENVATSNKANVRMYISNVREKMNVALVDHKYIVVDEKSNEKEND